MKDCKYFWTSVLQNSAKWTVMSVLFSELFSFHSNLKHHWERAKSYSAPALESFIWGLHASFPNKWIMYLFNRLWAAYWLSTDWVTLRTWGKSNKWRWFNQGHVWKVCKELCSQTNVFWWNSCRLGHSGFTCAWGGLFNVGPQFL